MRVLTVRQREVLDHVLLGKMNKNIAYDMKVAEPTVKSHIGKILRHFKVNTKAELVARLSEREESIPLIKVVNGKMVSDSRPTRYYVVVAWSGEMVGPYDTQDQAHGAAVLWLGKNPKCECCVVRTTILETFGPGEDEETET